MGSHAASLLQKGFACRPAQAAEVPQQLGWWLAPAPSAPDAWIKAAWKKLSSCVRREGTLKRPDPVHTLSAGLPALERELAN